MKRIRSVVLVIAGMVLGAVASAALVSRAVAQPPAGPPAVRYHYKCEFPKDPRYWTSAMLQELNRMGEQGYRWLGPDPQPSNGGVFCFERAH